MDPRVSALAQRIGVSRVAHLTGLDRVGLPVAAAIRPGSRNLTVSFGKGWTVEAAEVSAVMEAAELFFSERPPHPPVSACYAQLTAGAAVDPAALAERAEVSGLAQRSFDWVTGRVVGTGAGILVPWPVVSMDYTVAARAAPRVLAFGATGLAAGFDADAALLHGLYEVVERDCHQAWNMADDEVRETSLVDPGTLATPAVTSLLDLIVAAGLRLLLWEMTGEDGIPCFLAEVFDPAAGASTAYVQGAAARLQSDEAAERAIMEALQIRLTYISGGRDDLDYDDYGERYAAMVENRLWVAEHVPARRCTSASDKPASATAALNEVARRLARRTGGQILAVPLTAAADGVAVVKVIVPSLRDMRDAPRAEIPLACPA
jgi:ribosomal protein S12 methylthiotransferase accessory factor